jgi:hypothetical protein
MNKERKDEFRIMQGEWKKEDMKKEKMEEHRSKKGDCRKRKRYGGDN